MDPVDTSPDVAKQMPHRVARRVLVIGAASTVVGLSGYLVVRRRRDPFPTDPRVRWSQFLPISSELGREPVVANGTVYVGNGGGLQAIDGLTGRLRWQIEGEDPMSSPAVADGVVYVGSGGVALALSAADGRVRWRKNASNLFGLAWSNPAVADGVVYWSTYHGGVSVASPLSQQYLAETTGCVVSAWDAASGDLRWLTRVDGALLSPTAVAAGMVYTTGVEGTPRPPPGGAPGTLRAMDARTGHLRWQRAIATGVSRPAVGPDVVCHNGDDGTLYAFDAATGTPRWDLPTGRPPGLHRFASPVIAGGVVYISGEDGHLHAVDAASGNRRWKAPGADTDATPAVANGRIYFAGNDHKLHALDAATGQQRWTSRTQGSGGWVTATDDTVYHLAGYLSAFRA
jgi:outer membrane protein assembly factor BamB